MRTVKTMVYFSIFAVISFCMMAIIFLKKIYIKTSTMAIVMSIGIIIHGVLYHLYTSDHVSLKVFSLLNIALWLAFVFSITLAAVHKQFTALHMTNPVNRFGIGTWIAGTSICAILIFEQFTHWRMAAVVLSSINVGLWFIYIGLSLRSFYELRHKHVHGILLLTTVSTQSIVLLLNVVHKTVPIMLDRALIGIGLSLYLIGAFFIMKHRFTADWTIEDHWANTNCILHGALSITGFACIMSEAVSRQLTLSLWLVVVGVFILVEAIEMKRLVKRLKRYGFKQGLWTYDVTQWSRIFTFAMFYTFTSLVEPDAAFLILIRETILASGVPVIFLLLAIEILLYSPFALQTVKKPIKDRAA
ncbi:hypothetical protein F9802_08645 [Bacillus aerolatus]|uniref:Uncharacterized protein n=1 Tax=Bacillus aerolatus TaxID=2653354 RepID=A0A6I1FVS1_9BACI|nr:hypothetical protein [Bacillus aerolatus]KAB7707071.1 hypothetical protein F9802_08645 [Bacillus aerolatus]